jgi:hypothetical protein
MSTVPPAPPTPPTPPAPKTKKCLDCDAEVGENEKECPKCHVVFEDVDQETSVVEKALARIAKKRKAARNPPTPPTPGPAPKKKSIFSSLNRTKRTPPNA